ncbi:MFS transporter [Klebsiella pneumoniae]|uniref:MFS transporter n=1 Tax=Klebsiella pneumoniae TaxID=573 RepID=UPI000DE6B459|nr:MFS transporter [Klebsiella pneumoniae]MDK6678186.1 MFS transporter [Klebsiella pneumoniae]MDK8105558.1 MFS transporter [Klebsiella pneumoniae]SSF35582.1 putative integral membrane transport protein [Klebsiella pneumoniae]HBW2198106.1 MFS transporter [Klebsiella pneumoniae]HBX7580450.1 MFS transporter [Klebsiella pneumoniae]
MKEIALPLHPAPARVWIAVVALGICAFSIVTSELAPVGMLSALAADFHQTESGVGLAVTAYGWVGALAALLSGAMPTRISRKALLVGLMLILALSCLAATRSYSMFALMSARMIGALAHGAFWALIGIVAAQLVPPHRLGLATAIIFGGVSAASVVGVPLASFIATLAGWRLAFMSMALLSLAAPAPVRLRVYRDIFRNPLLGGLYGATACIITAHFAAFTYIEPLLINLQGVPATALSGLLLLSGGSGLLGNVIAGKLIDRHLKGLIFAALLLSGGALALLGAARLAPLPFCFSGLLLALWGAGIAIVFVGLQTWLLRSAGAVAQPASAIYVAIFNAAIGTGAFVGGQLIASAGLSGMVWLAAGIMVGSTLLIALLKAPLPGQVSAATAGA